jgi:peptidyl-prolyl cis-trans isomerase D
MAVIQKIRNKYGKIAAGVIVLSLVGFILMDATSSGRLNDLIGRDESVVKVNGDKVDYKEYLTRQHEYEVLYAAFQPDMKMDDMRRAQLNDQVLRELIYEKLVEEECDKLGISVSEEEKKELIYGANPDPLIQQFPRFKNPESGMFEPQAVKQFEQAINSSTAQIDPTTRAKLQEEWQILKSFALRSYRTNKYNSVVMAGLTAPKYLVDLDIEERRQMATLNFVAIPYATISDDQAKVTDDEIKDYMEKHKKEYMVYDPSRTIDYIAFDIMPTGDDSSKSLGALQKLKDEFVAATDNETIVNRNSDESYKDMYVNKRIFMSQYADSIMNLPVGAVYGPYFENGNFKLSKVTDRKSYPDSVKVRLIRVVTKAQDQVVLADSAGRKKMDSAVAEINAGTPFAQVAAKYSDDDGSKQTGGEYTFTIDQKTGMMEELATAIFEGSTGDKKTITINNDNLNALFYLEILEQSGIQPAVKIATISKSLSPGAATDQGVYSKATQFASRNNTAQKFDEAAKTHPGRRVAEGLKENDFMVQGLEGGNVREVIRWAYEAEVGDVSPVFNLEGRYVVAKLNSVQKKGLPAINDVNRPMLEKKVRSEKKAKLIADKYKGMNSLQAIAQASAQPVQTVDSVAGGSMYIPKLGMEPKVIGYTFFKGFQLNTVSPAIKGQEAVYYISVANRWSGPAPDMPGIMENQARMIEMQLKNSAGGTLMDMLRRNADIKYNVKNL